MYSVHDVPTTQLPTESSYLQEPNPPNFEERVQHFMGMYHRGETIPPILYHTNPDGTVKILDGRARLEAFRRLQVSHIPAVENFSMSSIGKTLGKAFSRRKEEKKVQKLVANRHKEALSPREAKVYENETLETKERIRK